MARSVHEYFLFGFCRVCQGLRIKDKVMLLITSKDREVAGEALLCVQKLMLNNWQDVARQVDR